MCGLTGFYQFKTQMRRSDMHIAVQSMASALTHRGPDQGDVWMDEDINLAFGHRRLSILDLSDSGKQPMRSPSGRFMMVYNGEIFNVLELAKELSAEGVTFRGHSDTEVILAGCDLWGINIMLQKMHGMFAIALWDMQTRQLHLIRDRLGKKPLYVGWLNGGFLFGSELKALRAHPDYQQKLNAKAAELYFRYAYVPAPYAIDDGVWQLFPGHRLTMDLSSENALGYGDDLAEKMIPYWHAREIAMDQRRVMRHVGHDAEMIKGFDELLRSCVRDRMISDVPLGAFLSGGVDSSAVVALMQAEQGQAVKTYTIGFEESGFDEAKYAREVAAHLGTDHHELYVSQKDAIDVIADLPSMYDEPFADVSAIPTALVSRFARQSVTVALSGDGGDEMLGGYNRHVEIPKVWNAVKNIPSPLRRAAGGCLSSVPTGVWDVALSPLRPQAGVGVHKMAAMLGACSPAKMYENVVSHWKNQSPMVGVNQLAALRIDPYSPSLSAAEQMMLEDARSYLPSGVLVKVDRASMNCGLEVRAPLLDKRVFEYVWTLPLEYKVRDGSGKWLLKQVLKKYVPDHLFERPKQGFTMPVGRWLSGDLRGWAEDLLDEKKLEQQGILDAKLVRAIWRRHLAGKGQHETQLWSILMFQAWAQKWM